MTANETPPVFNQADDFIRPRSAFRQSFFFIQTLTTFHSYPWVGKAIRGGIMTDFCSDSLSQILQKPPFDILFSVGYYPICTLIDIIIITCE